VKIPQQSAEPVDIDDDTEETFVSGREEIEARLIP
jgi:hypothetical protein